MITVGNPNDILVFSLNAAAIADINAAAGGFFSVGGSLLTSDGDDLVFSDTTSFGTQSLILEVAPVPEPPTLLLLGTGLVGLVGYSRRKRRA